MPARRSVGLVGFGRIGQFITERIAAEPDIELNYVYTRDATATFDQDVVADIITDWSELADRNVDLIIEAAHADLVAKFDEDILSSSDLMVLSTTALADSSVEDRIIRCCKDAETTLYVPHGAVLGTDGLQDGQPSIGAVSIETRKNPSNIDFSASDTSEEDINSKTTVYDGPTRGICREYPRNVNSHATVALAGIGFDETKSTLIADPSTTEATHRIVAKGEDTTLEIERSSTIEGVTGSYTLDSIWGSIYRILAADDGIAVV